MIRLLLVRHGQSTWNALGRWQGQADPPLTDIGRRQAAEASAAIGAVDAIFSSTLERARVTAEIIAELYADDLAAYGDRWSLERLRSGPDTWSDDALKHAAYLTVANERIGDLSRQALTYRRRWRRAVRDNRGLRRQLRELQDSRTLERTRPSPGRRLVRRIRALGGSR